MRHPVPIEGKRADVANADAAPDVAPDLAMAERLAAVLRFRTITPDAVETQREPDAFEAMRRYLEGAFPNAHQSLDIEPVGDANALLMAWHGHDERSARPWLFVSHQDVVPVDDEDLWQHPPFAGALAEGHVWGRGALDLKVTMVAILEAIESLLAEGFRPRRSVYLAFGGDEESGGQKGAARIAALLRERGSRFAFTLDEGGVIAQGMFPGVSRPVALIGTAQKGFATLRMTVKAKGGHAAVPADLGAIDRLARAIRRIGNAPMPSRIDGPTRKLFNRLSRFARRPFNWIYGSHRPLGMILCQILKRSPEIGAALRSTAIVTRIEGGVADNVGPQSASCLIDCRLKPGESVADLAHHIRSVVNDRAIRIEVVRSHPASAVSSARHPGYRAIEATLKEVFPEAIAAPFVSLNDTDSKHFEGLAEAQYRFVPVTLTKADLARIHGTDERIAIGDYARLVAFYAAFIRRLDQQTA